MLLENSEVFQDLSKNRADRVTQPRGAELGCSQQFFPLGNGGCQSCRSKAKRRGNEVGIRNSLDSRI